MQIKLVVIICERTPLTRETNLNDRLHRPALGELRQLQILFFLLFVSLKTYFEFHNNASFEFYDSNCFFHLVFDINLEISKYLHIVFVKVSFR